MERRTAVLHDGVMWISVRLREDKYRRVELGGSSPQHFYSSGDISVLNDLFKDVWIAK